MAKKAITRTMTAKTLQTNTTDEAKEERRTFTEGIIAVDNGGLNTKIFSEVMEDPISISSRKAYGHNNLRLTKSLGEGSYKIKWDDQYYFFGSLILESDAEMSGYTNTKAKPFFILSILQAVALYGFDKNKVITCTPFSRYTDEERGNIESMLVGKHELEINDELYEFEITDVLVTSETSPAFFVDMPEGKVRWLDLGSRTVGYSTSHYIPEEEILDLLDKESNTIEKEGLDINRLHDATVDKFRQYVDNLSKELNRKWDEDDYIIVFGGGALNDNLMVAIKELYTNIEIAEDPLHQQVRGMLEIGLAEFGSDDE